MPPQSQSQHRHRAGKLRQSNKKHKTTLTSKRAQSRTLGGKVSSSSSSAKRRNLKHSRNAQSSREVRANMAAQKRNLARLHQFGVKRRMLKKRKKERPRVVGLISLSGDELGMAKRIEEACKNLLVNKADSSTGGSSSNSSHDEKKEDKTKDATSTTCRYETHKSSVTYLTSTTAFYTLNQTSLQTLQVQEESDVAVASALDLARTCDSLLFLLQANCFTTGDKDRDADADPDDMISERGQRILTALKAQGLPHVITVLLFPHHNQDNKHEKKNKNNKKKNKAQTKKENEWKRYVQRFANTEFGTGTPLSKTTALYVSDLPDLYNNDEEEDVMQDKEEEEEDEDGQESEEEDMEEENENQTTTKPTLFTTNNNNHNTPTAHLLRTLCTTSTSTSTSPSTSTQSIPQWLRLRPHLLSDGSAVNHGYTYDESQQQLHIKGYIRGEIPWDVHRLVHVPHVGTFHVRHVEVHTNDGWERHGGVRKTSGKKGPVDQNMSETGDDGGDVGSSIIITADPNKRESLDQFAVPDALMGEQNLIGFDHEDDTPHDDNNNNNNNNKEQQQNDKGSLRPAGWSDYQAAWLQDDQGMNVFEQDLLQQGKHNTTMETDHMDANDNENDNDHTNTNDHASEALDRGELAKQLNTPTPSITHHHHHADDLATVTTQAKRLHLQKLQRDELEFPDEVELSRTDRASERLARYRSLKNFKTSFWDAKEGLPESYGRIFHFDAFLATQKEVLAEEKERMEVGRRAVLCHGWTAGGGLEKKNETNKEEEAKKSGDDVTMKDATTSSSEEEEDSIEEMLQHCIAPHTYITLTLANVSPSMYRTHLASSPTSLLSAVTLLPHEHKVSVMNMAISQSASCDITPPTNHNKSPQDAAIPVKSKDVLQVRCGWRTWFSRPVFSHLNLNSDKHKMERFLPPGEKGGRGGAHVAASLFGPVTYGSCPVLVFRTVGGKAEEEEEESNDKEKQENSGGGVVDMDEQPRRRQLVATGCVLGADAERIVVKRIVLTGYPTRVHKRHATVKYMFYNPEDVKWFKPAGLTTKHGLRGHIIQSVGEHGTMKCLFNRPIQQHDTVCLPLYKRIYPKYAPTTTTTVVEEKGVEEGEDGRTTVTKKQELLVVL